MLSIYEEFPEYAPTQSHTGDDESEIQFIPASAPRKYEAEDPFGEQGIRVHGSVLKGVAFRLLPQGDAKLGVINVMYPRVWRTQNGRTSADPRELADLTPCSVYRARGRYWFNEIRQEPYFDIWELLPILPDPELDEISVKAAEPVLLATKHGALTLNRDSNEFERRAEDLDIWLSLEYDGDGLLLAQDKNVYRKFKSGLKFIDTVLSDEYLRSARRFAAEKVLREANRWRHDVADAEGRATPAPKLSINDVYSKLSAKSVLIPQRGSVQVELDDGYMFGGHSVTVKTKRDGTPTSIEK